MRARAARARRAPSSSRLAARHDAAWRDPVAVAAQWADADAVDPRLLAHRARGDFWDILAERRVTLLVTREYEHLLVALHAGRRGPTVSWLPLPHPNGLAVDPARGVVHVASTRNPNQLFELHRSPASSARGIGRDGSPAARSCRCAPASSPAASTCTTSP